MQRLEIIDQNGHFGYFQGLIPLNQGIKFFFQKNKNVTFLHLSHRSFMKKIRKIQCAVSEKNALVTHAQTHRHTEVNSQVPYPPPVGDQKMPKLDDRSFCQHIHQVILAIDHNCRFHSKNQANVMKRLGEMGRKRYFSTM